MKRSKRLLTTALFWLASFAMAEQLYISDKLQAPIRAGAGDNYRITKMINAGEPVVKLAERNGYYQIRYDGNKTGWIYNTFLMNEPSARNYIEEAKNRYEPLLQENRALEEEIERLKEAQAQALNRANQDKEALLNELEVLTAENQALQSEIVELRTLNAREIELAQENDALNRRDHVQKVEITTLKQENARLQSVNRSSEWTAGALILLGGIILGTSILPRLFAKTRRKRTWDF
ncbi:hypothetical protein GCM10007161_01790 [Ignatzschineria indica]|uniref:TIGR04211 family SH3 domain-containing protein n=1 Tax=Ignatzschineria indica TaxID=472583 RepID=A0A2U2AM30_9GAMM|nr:TIGR04211 family SH3 domain-containing protein [Ignatzschineria indica]PWD84196.1 TIGR04211 family SH3 domain-containing protein [Ignatzschineria indica]GGZ74646.1 hypothetical protein GCM10007161_01790 [Ignatzschineria indica]